MQQVPSDHPTMTTIRATLARSGATARPRVDLPDDETAGGEDVDEDFPADEIVRLVLDGTEYHARIERAFGGDGLQIRGAYDTPRLARNPGEGANRLVEWFESSDLEFGRSVLVDVVTAGFKYGLREPGTRAVYSATEAPDESLASIARQLEDGE